MQIANVKGRVGSRSNSQRGTRCEWEAYLWCISPGSDSRYKKWHYIVEVFMHAIPSSFGEKGLAKAAVYS